MGVMINRVVGFLTSPLSVAMTAFVVGFVLLAFRRRWATVLLVAGVVWLCARDGLPFFSIGNPLWGLLFISVLCKEEAEEPEEEAI